MQIRNNSIKQFSKKLEGKPYIIPGNGVIDVPNNLQNDFESWVDEHPELEMIFDEASVQGKKYHSLAKKAGMSDEEYVLLQKMGANLKEFKHNYIDRLTNKCMSWLCHSGIHTTVGGAAVEEIPSPGATTEMIPNVTMNEVGAAPVTILSTKCIADKIQVTFSADPSTDHKVNYSIITKSL
jgi:hypothetical protein